MTEKEDEELVKKGNEIVEHLMETLHNEMGEGVKLILMKYIVAKFAASNILVVQEMTEQSDIEDEFFDLTRKMMAIMGEHMKIQSLKNMQNDIQKKVEDLKKEN